MRTLTFHLVNVFAESMLEGNPLCVFEDGSTLSSAQMQALALQFNLSETTFLLPSTTATRHMRIFTPLFEMRFAGHPTLGSSHIVRMLTGAQSLTLQTLAGSVAVAADGDRWEFRVPNAPQTRPFSGTRAALADALALDPQDIIGEPLYVNTGNEQFIVPLASRDAVMRCGPSGEALRKIVSAQGGERYMVYVFAKESEGAVVSRFFFPGSGGMIEDPGTGSACANLGGYLLATGAKAPFAITVDQGEKTGRRCRLSLRADAFGDIFVGGRCVRIGGGTITLA